MREQKFYGCIVLRGWLQLSRPNFNQCLISSSCPSSGDFVSWKNREQKTSNVCVVFGGWLHFSRPNFSNSVCFQGFALALDNFSRYSICAFGGWLGWLAFSRKSRNFFSNVCVVLEGWLHFSRPNFSNSVCFQGFDLALDNFSRYSMCDFGGWLGWLAFSRENQEFFFKCVCLEAKLD